MNLESYERFWEQVMNTIMEGVVVLDRRGTILEVNQAMEEITGYGRQELVGKPCALIKSDACFEARMTTKHCELFHNGSIRHRRCSLARKDGSLVHVVKNAALLKDHDGQVLGGIETFTDISEMMAKERVISRLRRELSQEDGFQGILGRSPVMLQLFSLISSAAASDAPVIIYGESGTGKELVAGAIHRLGPRSKGPFIKVNSAALSESLLETELFGHVKGAFTGADRTRVGRFEAAHQGDIFLDEVGDLPLATQAKLLRVLQEKVVEKVGDHRPISVDVRVISATNQDLERLMAEGLFREDLYYRINVIPIHIPPLRERREDIPLLVDAFIERAYLKNRKPITGISKNALDILLEHKWPGNVRELINTVEYAFVLCQEGTIRPEHLPRQLGQKIPEPSPVNSRAVTPSGANHEEVIVEAIRKAGGKKGEAARLLGVSRVTLWKWLKNLNLGVDEIMTPP